MKKILIVGAGISGLSTAIACIKRGMCVRIFERNHEISEIGAGLQVTPNGMKVLEWMGIQQEISDNSFTPHELQVKTSTGGNLFSIPIIRGTSNKWDDSYVQLYRKKLIQVLANKFESIKASTASELYLDSEIVKIENKSDDVSIELINGTAHTGDFLLVADGVGSKLRQSLFENSQPEYSKYIVWRALANSHDIKKDVPSPSTTAWIGKNKHCVTYRLHRGVSINFVGITESPTIPKDLDFQENKEAFLSAFSDMHSTLKNTIAQGQGYSVNPLYIAPKLPTWRKDKVLLIGDAAHAMLPFLSQGASMAFEDGYTISQLLSAWQDQEITLDECIKKYEAIRMPRINNINKLSNRNSNLFHSKSIYSAMTHIGIKLASKIFPFIANKYFSDVFDYDVIIEANK